MNNLSTIARASPAIAALPLTNYYREVADTGMTWVRCLLLRLTRTDLLPSIAHKVSQAIPTQYPRARGELNPESIIPGHLYHKVYSLKEPANGEERS